MAEFARTIVSRLREYVGDRRQARRQSARLELKLSLPTNTKSLNGTRRLSSMDGHTLDVSNNGLAIIVPKITLGDHHLVGENRMINVNLQLPDGPVEMQTAPVRYERLEEHKETGYVIAVKIVNMSAEDRERFTDFVESLRKGR
jgi:hypothetical protein